MTDATETETLPWYRPRCLWRRGRWQCLFLPHALAVGVTYYPRTPISPPILCAGIWPLFLYFDVEERVT